MSARLRSTSASVASETGQLLHQQRRRDQRAHGIDARVVDAGGVAGAGASPALAVVAGVVEVWTWGSASMGSACAGPGCTACAEMRPGVAGKSGTLSGRGWAIVGIQPPPDDTMRPLKSFTFSAALVCTALLCSAPAAWAQAWPSKQPIKLVAVFPPGGSVDQVARILAPPLQQQLGQSVIVDNKGGASGSIGTGAVAAAPADGYTFAVVFDTHGVNPSLIPSLPFDTRKDLAAGGAAGHRRRWCWPPTPTRPTRASPTWWPRPRRPRA